MNRPGRRAPFAITLLAAACVALPAAHAQDTAPPDTAVPGAPKSAKTKTLEAGARLLQRNAPLHGFDIYLVGFHPMKDQPEMQMEAHHYCHQVNEDFAQCVLFDGNTGKSNMNGVEYIISEKLFATLPPQERPFWHPHNGEILSGQLVAPGIPAVAEKALMRQKMNSYGKTWHAWNTGHEGGSPDQLPLGPARLAWSFSRDGEAIPAMIERRDRRLGINSGELRRQRAELQKLAKPQLGVDDLKGKFARPAKEIPGVVGQATAAKP